MQVDPEQAKIIGQIIGQVAVTLFIELGRAGLRAWRECKADGRRRSRRHKTKQGSTPRRRRTRRTTCQHAKASTQPDEQRTRT